MSIILGIDPGTTTVGFGVIEANGLKRKILNFGVIHTTPKLEISQKLLDIAKDLEELIVTYRPDACGIERLYFSNNQKTAIDVAQSRGVLIHAIAKHGIPLFEYTPLQVKKGICGSGSAPKAQVQNALKILFGLSDIPKPDDAADALAIAYIASLARPRI